MECLYLPGLFVYNFRVNMASEHQPDAPSLEFSDNNDSDCYIIDSGNEVEIEYDESESEAADSASEVEMVELKRAEYVKRLPLMLILQIVRVILSHM